MGKSRNQDDAGGPRWRAATIGRDLQAQQVLSTQTAAGSRKCSIARSVTDAAPNCAAVIQTAQTLLCAVPASCSKACTTTMTCARRSSVASSSVDANRDFSRIRIIILGLLLPRGRVYRLIVIQDESSAHRPGLRSGSGIVDRPDKQLRGDRIARAVVEPEVSALLDMQPARAVE